MNKKENSAFEIVVQVRDSLGNPTGKTRSLESNSPQEISQFFNRNVFSKKEPSKKRKGTQASIKDKTIKAIKKLAGLSDGWNGPHSKAINYISVENAKNFATQNHDLFFHKPKVKGENSGAVRIEFENQKTESALEFVFQPDNTVLYYLYLPAQNKTDHGMIFLERPALIRELMQQI